MTEAGEGDPLPWGEILRGAVNQGVLCNQSKIEITQDLNVHPHLTEPEYHNRRIVTTKTWTSQKVSDPSHSIVRQSHSIVSVETASIDAHLFHARIYLS